jgi:superfamily II DNA helicase RecQ
MSLKFRSNPKGNVRGANVKSADLVVATSQDDSVQIPNDELIERLKSYRSKTAKAAGLKAYHVFTNKTLDELVAKRPLSINDLQGIQGLGQKRIEAYGAELVMVINKKL